MTARYPSRAGNELRPMGLAEADPPLERGGEPP